MIFGQSADLGETDIQGAIHVNVHTASFMVPVLTDVVPTPLARRP